MAAGKRAGVAAAAVAAMLLAGTASAKPPRAKPHRVAPTRASLLSVTTRAAERPLPTGQSITPLAAHGANFVALNPDLPTLPGFTAGQTAAMALSPDQRTLLVLTSGYNRQYDAAGKVVPSGSNEYVFVYDVTGAAPVKRQVVQLPNSFLGIAWAPQGRTFYVSGGIDDMVREYTLANGDFTAARTFALGHKAGLGLAVKPGSAGLAVSPDGKRLLVANLQNDSVSLIDLASGNVAERDLRPGIADPAKSGQPGGTFPRAVVWLSDTKAYITSERDRELIALNIDAASTTAPTIGAHLTTRGQPTALIINKAQTRLYATLANSDAVVVVDPARDRVIASIATTAPAAIWANAAKLGGAGSNALALSTDERTLFVSNGGENAVAVIALGSTDANYETSAFRASEVVGLIPTGWYPTAVAVTRAGQLFVTNNKSQPGPNPGGCRKTTDALEDDRSCQGANQYVWQLEKGGLLSLPVPSGAELGRLTRQVAVNDHFPGFDHRSRDQATMAFVRARIRHVIYIVKENRTYDQVLGDLGIGNGDPKLTLLGAAITPNHHALARQFVTLDAFFDSGESSNTGWNWTTAARTTDFTEREAPVNYAGRGLQYDQEGNNRNVNVSFATATERLAANPLTPADPNILAGTADVAAPDGPGGDAGHGYLWDNALRAGKSVRNYGFYGDLSRYDRTAFQYNVGIPLTRDPFAAKLQVFYTTKAALRPITDPYFRGFDQSFPDYYRFKEWEREFDVAAANDSLPQLTLLRLAHDHFGNFKTAIDGVDTIETMMADNDYALGRVIEKIAHSRYAADTLVFVIEDDAQNGADHVDAHRSMAFVVGPYVKQRAIVSAHHTTVDFVRTIEDVLGLPPMGLNDALAAPMSDVFETAQANWTYTATVPNVLRSTKLPLPTATSAEHVTWPRRTAAWWAAAMAGQNFAEEDRLDTAAFNRALWRGLKREPLPKQLAAAKSGKEED